MRRLVLPILLLAVAAGAAYAYVQSQSVPGPLNGLPVSRDVANRRPIAVMIDNFSPDARPQSGLTAASLIFETLAEGGITRFMPVYLENDAPTIGPVRSTRFYFNSWAAGLHAIFGHDGGNVDALQELSDLSTVYNVDAHNASQPYHRISSRLAPHNEYTGTPQLRSYAQDHGAATTGSPISLPHKSDAPFFQRPDRFAIHIQFSYADYNVTWQYDRGANDYRRFQGGTPDVDATTGKQLTAKNIVVMYTNETSAYDPFTPGSIHLATEGSNQAVVYQDGTAVEGTWRKPAVLDPLQWLDRNGNPVKLDKGVTWVEVVPVGNQVTAGST